MSLIRLTAKIDANATQFHSTLKGVENRAAATSKLIGTQLKAAFLYFAGFSGISRMVRGMAEMVDNIDELRPQLEQLGIELDDALVSKAKDAKAQWDATVLTIKAGLLPAFAELLHKSAEILVTWKFLFKQAFEWSNWLSVGTFLVKGKHPDLPKTASSWDDYGREIAALNDIRFKGITKDKADKTVAIKAAKEAFETSPELFKESLAKIGGFTGRAGEEIKSIQFRQLQKLERIETNTEPLKRGIG